MKPRLQIASQIYAQLVSLNLRSSIENPALNAHRALMFADALLICDQQSEAVITDTSDHDATSEDADQLPAPPLTQRIVKRRASRSSLN